jgi:hypothetical protein
MLVRLCSIKDLWCLPKRKPQRSIRTQGAALRDTATVCILNPAKGFEVAGKGTGDFSARLD